MKQQQLFKRFSLKSLLAGFLALGLFVLSCEEDSNSSKKSNSSLALHYKAIEGGSYEFYVKNFTKDGQVVFEEGVPLEQIKELLREYWNKSHVRWGFREKAKDQKDKANKNKIYWVQKNADYEDPAKNPADRVQYSIEAPQERKNKFIPTAFPSELLQKKVEDLEIVGVISNDKFELVGTVALPADLKTKLLQASKNSGGSGGNTNNSNANSGNTQSTTGSGGNQGNQGKLATPSSITLTAGSDSITVAWSAVTNASSYEVYYSKNTGFAIDAASGVTKVTVSSGTNQNVTGLSANTSYYFKIVAKATNWTDSDASAEKSVTTNKIKLATPTVTAPSDITSSAVKINWNAVTNASGYEIHYSKTDGFAIGAASGVSKRTVNGGGTTNSRFTGLDAGTAYYFKVLAKGIGGYSDSDASAQKKVTTADNPLPVPTISSIRWHSDPRAADRSRNRIVDFTHVANASGYRLVMQYALGVTGQIPLYKTFEVPSTASSFTINIKANTRFRFRIRALGTGRYTNSPYSGYTAFAALHP